MFSLEDKLPRKVIGGPAAAVDCGRAGRIRKTRHRQIRKRSSITCAAAIISTLSRRKASQKRSSVFIVRSRRIRIMLTLMRASPITTTGLGYWAYCRRRNVFVLRSRPRNERSSWMKTFLKHTLASDFSLHAGNYEWSRAEHHLKRAIELNPSNSNAYVWYSIVMYTEGRFAEGLQYARTRRRDRSA